MKKTMFILSLAFIITLIIANISSASHLNYIYSTPRHPVYITETRYNDRHLNFYNYAYNIDDNFYNNRHYRNYHIRAYYDIDYDEPYVVYRQLLCDREGRGYECTDYPLYYQSRSYRIMPYEQEDSDRIILTYKSY